MRRILAFSARIVAGFLAAAVLAPAAQASGIGIKAGTLGLGAEASFGLSDRLALRLGVYAGSASATLETDNFDYDADLDLENLALLVDWFPSARGSFRLSAGIVGGDRTIDGTAPLSQAFDDIVLPVGLDLGRLEGTLEAESVAPYVGLGWGRFDGDGRVGFTIDVGVVAQGAPEVTLRLDTPLPIDLVPGLRDAVDALLAAEAADLEREAEDYDLYPVLAVGVILRF